MTDTALAITRDPHGRPEALTCAGRPMYQRLPGPLLTPCVPDAGDTVAAFELRILEQRPDRVVLEALMRLDLPDDGVPAFVGFSCGLFPTAALGLTRAHLPKAVYVNSYHSALRELGDDPDPAFDLHVGAPGQNGGELLAHYLEPIGSSTRRTTRHPLLLPVAAWYQPGEAARLALVGTPQRPWELACHGSNRTVPRWHLRTRVEPHEPRQQQLRAWLVAYTGDHHAPYEVFHQYAHQDPVPSPDWLADVRVHYFDFLSPSSTGGPRGGGFPENIPHFRDFHVGLATTHGYYPHWGDYIHPQRDQWTAMKGDPAGAVPMSLDTLRQWRDDTRAQGSRFGVYMHLAGFDRTSPSWETLQHCVRMDAPGRVVPFPWDGPDMEGQAAFMSIRAKPWADHLLQQAQWIMELLDPDAIVVDETFAGVGYDHHPAHTGCCSPAMIRFMQQLRSIIKSFGKDRALLTSDCGMTPFSLWADGEGGDFAYGAYLGQPAFRRQAGGYASVLGRKPWLPCAWQANAFWNDQLDLARRCGAGVGVGNGWIEYAGLAGLPSHRRAQMLADLAELTAPRPRQSQP